MSFYPNVTEQDLNNLGKLAEQQKINDQLSLRMKLENKLMIKG